ncbi:hypothetical protein T492DRAFT_934505 [Pavlovales sp. CCMP2436]|nr:hypothetical protein T492DRAFT_934505 [Pavlovales sp. CCMP2436]
MLVGPLLVGMAVGMSSGQASLYSKLKGTQVFRATDLERVDVTAAWNADAGERAVAVFFRSFG